MRLKLRKSEKLCSLNAINALFAGSGTKGALAFPLRMVWRVRPCAPGVVPVRFFISVPKKRLRHAVDRVTMRRRIREAYRLNRDLIAGGVCADVAFIYVGGDLRPYARVESAMRKLLPQLVDGGVDEIEDNQRRGEAPSE